MASEFVSLNESTISYLVVLNLWESQGVYTDGAQSDHFALFCN